MWRFYLILVFRLDNCFFDWIFIGIYGVLVISGIINIVEWLVYMINIYYFYIKIKKEIVIIFF